MKTTFVLLLFGLFSLAIGGLVLDDPATFDRGGDDDDCPEPVLDGEQKCICGAGRKISEVLSAEFNSGKKDRPYVFTCTGIPGNVGGWSGDSWSFFASDWTTFDGAFKLEPWYTAYYPLVKGKRRHSDNSDFHLDCANCQDASVMNWILYGVESVHEGKHEDRKFKFLYARSTKFNLVNCHWSEVSMLRAKIEVPDSGQKAYWGDQKVFRRLESSHNNGKEDRIWRFEYCDLASKCRRLKEGYPKYKKDELTKTDGGDTKVNSKIINNLNMSYPVISTIELTESNTKGVSESYTFGGSQSSEIGASLEISQTASYGTPAVQGETSVTASINSLFSWESNWERSSSQEFSTEHSTTLSWEITCPSRCLCVREIKVEKFKYTYPYTIVAETPETGETCTEDGTVEIDLASEATLIGGDYTSEDRTELCEQNSDDLNINLKKLNRIFDRMAEL